jgi:hypothetical protein
VLKPALLATIGLLTAAVPATPHAVSHPAPAFDAEDIIAGTRAVYAALMSYADSGTVLDEASGFTDRSTFRTLFTRDPRNLLIESRAVASEYKNGNRVPLTHHTVLWMQNGELNLEPARFRFTVPDA